MYIIVFFKIITIILRAKYELLHTNFVRFRMTTSGTCPSYINRADSFVSVFCYTFTINYNTVVHVGT